MNNQGFTLFEVIIYSAIVAMILSFILITFNAIFSTTNQLRDQITLTENVNFLEQKFKWALTGSDQINSPSVGGIRSSISFERLDTTGSLVFDLDNGLVRLKIGSSDPVPLTDSFVNVTSLSFENLLFSGVSSNTIHVRADLEDFRMPSPTTSSIDLYITTQ